MPDERIASRFQLAIWTVLGLTTLYVVDHAVVDAPPATSAAHSLVLGLPLILLAALWGLAVRLARPGLKAWLALVAGGVMVAVGGMHVAHIQKSGFGGGDLTGVLVGLGGVLLLALAAVTVARPKARRRPLRKWAARLGVVVAIPLTIVAVVTPIYLGIYAAYKPAADVADSALPAGHRDFSLRTADGVRLAASYVPSRNGAAVVLVHGSGGDRGGSIASRARMLARHGFGVLLYDARGSGESDGHPENFGWTWPRDVRAAVDWLERRPDVHNGKIGALGLSTGAEVLLQAAAQDKRIRAVVGEGAQARSLKELKLLPSGGVKLFTSVEYAIALPLYRALTHAPTPPSLGTLVARIAPRRVLLISAPSSYEQDMNRAYTERGGRNVQLWVIPGSPHTGGLKTAPREYEKRVVGFLRTALNG